MENENKKDAYAKRLITLLTKKMDINVDDYNMDEMIKGMFVELEHGTKDEKTDITGDNPETTFKIVLAHLDELPDYYTRLEKMEGEAKSVKTDSGFENEDENSKDSEDEDEKEDVEEKTIAENTAKRFKELCGLVESTDKKQLKNPLYQEKVKVNLLKEEIDPKKFKIIKFNNDGLGKKENEEDVNLYKMEKKRNEN